MLQHAKTGLTPKLKREKQLISSTVLSDAGFVTSERPRNLFVQRFLSSRNQMLTIFLRKPSILHIRNRHNQILKIVIKLTCR